MTDDLILWDTGPLPVTEDGDGNIVPVVNKIPRRNSWKYLDWTVQADGYRLVIEDGPMVGLAYDEWPWLWGDPRYDEITVVYSWRGSMADLYPDSRMFQPGMCDD